VKTRIIGLGNTLLTDDGVGIYAARAISKRLGVAPGVDVIESEAGGFGLLDLISGWDRVILVDAVSLDRLTPGAVVRIEPEELQSSPSLCSIHQAGLPAALELGRRMGIKMPRELLIIGIQAQDCSTLGERLTPLVEAGLAKAVEQIIEVL
jgi:hydrogenase maturation protease